MDTIERFHTSTPFQSITRTRILTRRNINKKSNIKQIINFAESIQESFLTTACNEIIEFGSNSIFNNLEDLINHYYYSFYFTKVSRKINKKQISGWIEYAYPRKENLIKELRRRIDLLSNGRVILEK